MTTAEVLKTARSLIEKPERHTQVEYAKNAQGDTVHPMDPSATCWCAVGAVTKTAGVNGNDIYDHIAPHFGAIHALDKLVAHLPGGGIAWFNDNSTHAEVLAVFDEAIANEED